MIHARITIKEIQYAKSFEKLFPMGMEKCRQMENPNMAVRFLLKMGTASMTAALGILNLMDEKSKRELLCKLVNLYAQEIQSALNVLLKKDELGKNICIGDIYMAQDSGGQLLFIGQNIQVDYGSLVQNDTVKQKIGDYANKAVKKSKFSGIDILQKVAADGANFAVGAAVGIFPNKVEKKVLDVINGNENKGRLLQMAEQILDEKGLCLKLEDFVFEQETDSVLQNEPVVETVKEKKFEFSPELEEGLLDAVVGYLKMIVKE